MATNTTLSKNKNTITPSFKKRKKCSINKVFGDIKLDICIDRSINQNEIIYYLKLDKMIITKKLIKTN